MYRKDRDKLRGNFYFDHNPKYPGLGFYEKQFIPDAEKGCRLVNSVILSAESGKSIGDYNEDAVVFSMYDGNSSTVGKLKINEKEKLVYHQATCQFICRDIYDKTVYGWDDDFLLCNSVAASSKLLHILDYMDDSGLQVFGSNGVTITQAYNSGAKYHIVEITDGTVEASWAGKVWDFYGAMLPDDTRHQIYVLYQYVCDQMCKDLFEYIDEDVNMLLYRLKDRYPEVWNELVSK